MKHVYQILLFLAVFSLTSHSSFGQKGNINPTPNPSNSISCSVFIPNAFTPNGDDLNDRFLIQTSDVCQILDFNIQIFDRWGNLIYETKSPDPSQAWDGTVDGKESRQGVYMFTVYAKVAPSNGSEPHIIRKQGSFVLIR